MELVQLVTDYNSDQACRDYLVKLRWPNGVCCPRCGGEPHPKKTRQSFECGLCEYRFTVTAGTAFHKTHIPLVKWFLAVNLVVESKKGIASTEMARLLGITQKSAWYMNHRIRNAIGQAQIPLMGGVIEVDETWVGGKVRGMGKGYKGNKALVVGIMERGKHGDLVMEVKPDRSRDTVGEFIYSHALAQEIFTDDWPAYKGIATDTVNHSIREYARKRGATVVHTNTIENVWSLLKRSVIGTFHSLSIKHLDFYLDELAWKVQHRGLELFDLTLLQMLNADHISYKDLTA